MLEFLVLRPVFGSVLLSKYVISKEYFFAFNTLNEIDFLNDNPETVDTNLVITDLHESLSVNARYNLTLNKTLEMFQFITDYDDLCEKITIQMDATLFCMLILELERSKTFRFNFLLNFDNYYCEKVLNSEEQIRNVSSQLTNNCLYTKVYLKYTNSFIDNAWNKRLEILVNERCELENAMAWLSTLGGAFSALGDSYIHCAEKAALISVQQFQLAMKLGDPLTICRCKIYLAMSLLQRGYYKETKKRILWLYKFATGPEGSKDFRLKNMCLAVWNRLRYELSLKKAINGQTLAF